MSLFFLKIVWLLIILTELKMRFVLFRKSNKAERNGTEQNRTGTKQNKKCCDGTERNGTEQKMLWPYRWNSLSLSRSPFRDRLTDSPNDGMMNPAKDPREAHSDSIPHEALVDLRSQPAVLRACPRNGSHLLKIIVFFRGAVGGFFQNNQEKNPFHYYPREKGIL